MNAGVMVAAVRRRARVGVAMVSLIALDGPEIEASEPRKPNVLLFYADDLGYGELGCYGGANVPTPHIDSIAAGGIRFTQGYVSAPLCSPSRAGLMTGRYQTRFGHENNTMAPGHGLPSAENTLGDRMKALGYATGVVGKWHLGKEPAQLPVKRGFDEYFGVTGNPGSYFTPGGFIDSRISPGVRAVTDKGFYTTDAFSERAADWIGKQKSAPWFLYMPFNAVHTPHQATEKYLNRFSGESDVRKRNFYGMLSAMDDAVGRVMAKVRDLGLETNTLVFFISDNGAPGPRDGNGILRGGKHTTWEGGIRIPFLAQWKGRLPAGRVSDLPVVQLDVLPTCVAAAGGAVDPAWKLDGVNLLPYLSGGEKGRPHPTLCWRIDGMWAVRHGDWKLVHGDGDARAPALFDLSKDPGETNDLAAAQSAKAKELKALWDAWNREQATPAVSRADEKGFEMKKDRPARPEKKKRKRAGGAA